MVAAVNDLVFDSGCRPAINIYRLTVLRENRGNYGATALDCKRGGVSMDGIPSGLLHSILLILGASVSVALENKFYHTAPIK